MAVPIQLRRTQAGMLMLPPYSIGQSSQTNHEIFCSCFSIFSSLAYDFILVQ